MPKSATRTQFVHPIEEAFAKVLDFYGLEWDYEPKTYPLYWDDQGNVVEAFTPDFYLPQQNIFIELTTLRPSLSTNKNKKLRRFKELYPDVNIKLFNRKDLHSLMIKFGLLEEAVKIEGSLAQDRIK